MPPNDSAWHDDAARKEREESIPSFEPTRFSAARFTARLNLALGLIVIPLRRAWMWMLNRPPLTTIELNILMRAGAQSPRSRRIVAYALLGLLYIAGTAFLIPIDLYSLVAPIIGTPTPDSAYLWRSIIVTSLATTCVLVVVLIPWFALATGIWVWLMRITKFLPDAAIEATLRAKWRFAFSHAR